MRGTRWIGGSFVVAVGALVLSIASTVASPSVASAQSSGLPACISVATESRYVPYGYNHIVIVKNGCSKAATCSVATDVNPKATTVEIASNASVEVLTFTASPSQVFTAKVTCALH